MAGNFYATYPVGGGVAIYSTLSAFPVASTYAAGNLAVAADTGILYETDGSTWTAIAGPGSALSLGTFGSSPNSKGASLSSGTLTLQPADASNPGGVSTTTQSFAGNKTFTGNISALNLSGTNTGDQTITLTSDVTGSGTGSFATTVAKIQGTTVSGTTGTGNVVFATSPTLSNPVVGTQSQSDSSTKAASTAYVVTAVTNAIAGVNPAVAVQAATIAAGDTSGFTYNNGVSGIGATLTSNSTNTALTVDGYTFTAINQRLLVKNDTQSPSGAYNGVYYVTQLQALGLPLILTRALDYDTPSDINNTGAIPVINGTVNGTTSWVVTSQVTTVGTDPLTFTRFTRNPVDYLLVASNLSDVASKSTSFNNLSPMTTLGDITYEDATPSAVRLAGNTTATKKFLTQTGNGTISAAPGWNTIVTGDLPTIPISGGGTGQTSQSAAFDALSPMTTGGDLIYGGSSGTGTRLANGSSGTVLTSAGGTSAPTWTLANAGLLTGLSSGYGTISATDTILQGFNKAAAGFTVYKTTYDIKNLSFITSVASNALTVSLRDILGSAAPSSTNPGIVNFQNPAGIVNNTTVEVQVTAATNITAPSGASFGLSNGVEGYIYVYLIDNGGTVILGLSGTATFDEGVFVSTTAISASSTSSTVMYTTSAVSNKPCRLMGRIRLTEATAGVYASGVTETYNSTATTYVSKSWYSAKGGILSASSSMVPSLLSVGTDGQFLTASSGATTGLAWTTTLPVANGGTGQTTLTNHGVLVGAGTSAITQLSVPASGTLLTGVASSDPAFSATPTLGVAGTTSGTLALASSTASTGLVTLANQGTTSGNAYTFSFPLTGGTNGYALTTNGSGTTTWTSVLTNPMTTQGDMIIGGSSGAPARLAGGVSDGTTVTYNSNDTNKITWVLDSSIKNLGLSTSVASNALTIALKDAGGNDPSSSSPVIIPFRNTTAATGQYTNVLATGAISVVVSSGASLGQTSAINQYVWVYALNNAGTIELAVSGVKLFDDLSTQSTTAMSGSATSGTTLYSTTARTSKAIRLIGRLTVNETTAGTWASNATEVSLLPRPTPTMTDWSTTYSFTPSNFGTVSATNYQTRRVGDSLEAIVYWTNGTAASGIGSITMPGGLNISTSKLGSGSNATQLGTYYTCTNSGTPVTLGGNSNTGAVFYDGSTNNTIFFAYRGVSTGFEKSNANALSATSFLMSAKFTVPIDGWSTYGP